MTTEYRRGIPSHAHIAAAERLGLEWHRESHRNGFFTRFRYVDGQLHSNFGTYGGLADHSSPVISCERTYSYRPIRPDGTPVDWETLDAEVARVAGVVQPAQPQGFRADLWQRISRHFTLNRISSIAEIESIDGVCIRTQTWQWGWGTADREAPTQQHRADILARWTVYQELKPLYDLIDDCPVGRTVSLPVDVFQEWARDSHSESVREIQDALTRDPEWAISRLSLSSHSRRSIQLRGPYCSWYSDSGSATDAQAQKLSNFAAVLDAVAEARVRERTRQPTPATPTVTQPAQPEPRRFADVRPDRHGWRWWRVRELDGSTWRFSNRSSDIHALSGAAALSGIWLDRTVIPTDEQGNPVSWESIGPVQGADLLTQSEIDLGQPVTQPGIIPTFGIVQSRHIARRVIQETLNQSPQSEPLPRFTADELDDADHTATTQLDQATLRRGKLPTVEQIAKYREVRAKRTGGTVAEALKESRIDCEVAQYVLERWAGGLGSEDTVLLLRAAGCIVPLQDAPVHCVRAFDPKQEQVDERATRFLQTHSTALDTTEPPDTAAQQARQQAEERRQRLAQVQAQIAAERAAAVRAEEPTEVCRFDLIEPDPRTDPAASIRAWEARQTAAKRAQAVVATMPAKPAAVPRRPAIEVVDAETDGLSRGEVLAVLLGRAMHGGC